jgi:outer membrane protein
MSFMRMTAQRSAYRPTRKRIENVSGRYARPLVAAFLAVLIATANVAPASAQNPPNPPPKQDPTKQDPSEQQPPPPGTYGNVPPASQAGPEAATGTAPPPAPPIPVSLGLSKHSFVHGPRAFPTLIAPYKPIQIDEPILVNSPRIDQLIHDGKLQITLQDAVEFALENSLDISVARYNPWIADTDILRTKAGGQGRGTPGADFPTSQANIDPFNQLPSYDPILSATTSLDSRTTPVNNPFLSGTGLGANVQGLHSHASIFDVAYQQSFTPGTTVNVGWNNTRSSSTSAANFFNPSVQSSLTAGFSQQLLNGFGSFVGRRNILIAKNNRKIADLVFVNQAITTVTSAITAYWELVYARENVKVQQQAVAVSEKLYNDNKKQLEIGTMAPLDVTRAASEVASDRQNLIVAQTTQLQDEQVLKNAMTKNPLAPNLINVEIIPTDLPTPPAATESASFEDAIQEAFVKRPDLQEQVYNLKNSGIEVRATKNALLPTLTLSGQYSSSGLAGNSPITGTPIVTATPAPIVDSAGNPVTITGADGVQTPIFQSTTTAPVIGASQQGFGTAQNQIFTNQFPDYFASLNLFLPLRNRSAQADNARAMLTQRQLETQLQQLKNAALLDVRNTYIALEQDRARVDAAIKARELQKQTFEAEQKKYTLGASTVYNVILTQRDYVTAQGVELRALADLNEAKANFERAVGRTLEVNRVTIASTGTKSGLSEFEPETLIPGTLHGQVVGTDKIFSNPTSPTEK